MLQREEIYQAVWGYAMAHGDRSVDVFVRKLRQKLETASPDWSYIHTHFGVGYRFQPEGPGGPDEAAAFEASLGHQPELRRRSSSPETERGELARLRHLPEHELATFRRRMSRNQRIGLIVAAVVVAVVAFVIASSSGGDDTDNASQTNATTAPTETTGTGTEATPAPAAAGGHEDRHPRWRGRRAAPPRSTRRTATPS